MSRKTASRFINSTSLAFHSRPLRVFVCFLAMASTPPIAHAQYATSIASAQNIVLSVFDLDVFDGSAPGAEFGSVESTATTASIFTHDYSFSQELSNQSGTLPWHSASVSHGGLSTNGETNPASVYSRTDVWHPYYGTPFYVSTTTRTGFSGGQSWWYNLLVQPNTRVTLSLDLRTSLTLPTEGAQNALGLSSAVVQFGSEIVQAVTCREKGQPYSICTAYEGYDSTILNKTFTFETGSAAAGIQFVIVTDAAISYLLPVPEAGTSSYLAFGVLAIALSRQRRRLARSTLHKELRNDA